MRIIAVIPERTLALRVVLARDGAELPLGLVENAHFLEILRLDVQQTASRAVPAVPLQEERTGL